MNRFEYARAASREEAVRLLAAAGSSVLAGGTDLLSLIKDGAEAPSRLVDIKGLSDLQGIETDSATEALRIGALVTLRELIADETVASRFPSLIQAAEGVRSQQIRNRGTVGGDLCQRPRCWYYRNGFGLLAMQNGQSMVLEGDSRYHAVFGNAGPAYFVNPSSLAPALIALEASLEIFGPDGARAVPVAEFFTTPQGAGEKEYSLAGGELVTAVAVPLAATKNATYEVRQKEALDWPLAAASVALKETGGSVSEARVVLGHVAPVPWVSSEAAAAVTGRAMAVPVAESAGRAALRPARPLAHNAYKVKLAQVAVKRALLRAAGMEG